MIDLLNYFISTPIGACIAALLFTVCAAIVYRIAKYAVIALTFVWSILKSATPEFGCLFSASWMLLSFVFYVFSAQIIDVTDFLYQYYFAPVRFSYYDADNSSFTEQAYTNVLRRNTTDAEYQKLMVTTDALAKRYGSTTLNFLEVYESECALNPYACYTNEKGDTTAAGQIQFTATGISGLSVDSVKATMEAVRRAIRARDMEYLCKLEIEYFNAVVPKGKQLLRPCDVYTAVFMPAYIGAPDDTVIASEDGKNPEYYNRNCAPLDGWEIRNGIILHGRQYRDGKITIKDLSTALAYRKALLLKNTKKQ